MKKILPVLLAFSACAAPSAPENRFEKLATGLCDCLAPVVAANAEAEKMMADPAAAAADTAAAARIFEKMETADRRARDCGQTLRDRFQPLKKEDWPAAKPFFQAKCPFAVEQTTLVWRFLGEGEN